MVACTHPFISWPFTNAVTFMQYVGRALSMHQTFKEAYLLIDSTLYMHPLWKTFFLNATLGCRALPGKLAQILDPVCKKRRREGEDEQDNMDNSEDGSPDTADVTRMKLTGANDDFVLEHCGYEDVDKFSIDEEAGGELGPGNDSAQKKDLPRDVRNDLAEWAKHNPSTCPKRSGQGLELRLYGSLIKLRKFADEAMCSEVHRVHPPSAEFLAQERKSRSTNEQLLADLRTWASSHPQDAPGPDERRLYKFLLNLRSSRRNSQSLLEKVRQLHLPSYQFVIAQMQRVTRVSGSSRC